MTKFGWRNYFLIFGLFFSAFSIAETTLNFPFLLANGEAEIKVKPDEVKIYFNVMEFNKDPNIAEQVVAKRAQAIVALARSMGIEDDRITSEEYRKETKRKRGDNYQDLDIVGYEVSQSFTIDIRNVSLYSPFADKLIGSQNVQGIRPEFKVSNEVELNRELTKQATLNAKRNATDLAEAMGVKLGGVYAISEDHHFASLEAVFGIYRGGVNAPPDFVPPPSLSFVPDSSSGIMFIPKTITLTKSVSAVYKIK